ncbi:MAG: hypothetical protein EBY26_00340 [Microbacteriaceae bacterium]|nr:hypothetical protein [Microbacteriaceae bacterium]
MEISAAEAFASEANVTPVFANVSDTATGVLVGTDPRFVAEPTNTATPTTSTRFYTDEDLARARAQEKEKLYPTIEKMKEELASIKKEREERLLEEERLRQEAEEGFRRKAESEMDIRTLLEQKEKEFQEQLDVERGERQKAFALLEQERQYQELTSYRQQRLEQEREAIIPELLDLVDGNTSDEIESSIAGLKERSSRILDSAQQAMQAARRDMSGARVTAPAAGPLDTNSENNQLSAEQISGMPFNEYVKHRSKLLGQATATRNRGLFG